MVPNGLEETIEKETAQSFRKNGGLTPNQGVFSRSLDISPVRWVFGGKTYII